MRKIPSLFKRDYGEGRRLVYDELVPGTEWVQRGEGVATVKFDGTACMVRNGKLYKRRDRKPSKRVWRRHERGTPWKPDEFRDAPPGWEACEDAPNLHTGHWPGWIPVGEGPEDVWHRRAWENYLPGTLPDGSYELVGYKVQDNPYSIHYHAFWRHGASVIEDCPTGFEGLREFFTDTVTEGIVWHHPDGRMVKIKRRDFGFDWPQRKENDDSTEQG